MHTSMYFLVSPEILFEHGVLELLISAKDLLLNDRSPYQYGSTSAAGAIVSRSAASVPFCHSLSRATAAAVGLVCGTPVNAAFPQERTLAARPKINTLKEIGPAIRACFQTPKSIGPYSVTIRVSFNRWGAIIGKPDVTFSEFGAGIEGKQQVAGALATSLRACTPLPFTDSLGKAVAGRIFTFRFTRRPPEQRARRMAVHMSIG
jgi:hypothetical protein